MFSALSSFLFGGEKTSPTETPVDYDLKEDDEWMLVDVSGDKENIPNSICEESIVDLGNLRNDIFECDKSIDEDEETFECLPQVPNKDNQILPSNVFHSFPTAFDSSWEIPANVNSFYELFPDTTYSPVFQTLQNDNTVLTSNNNTELESTQQFRTKLVVMGMMNGTKVLYDIICSTTSVRHNLINKLKEMTNRNKQSKNNEVSIIAARTEGTTTTRIQKVPAETKTPIKLSKKEYMQHIQELIPSQQAKEYQAKKYIKKSQLNRKNRVCMYESSNKNRHRRDLMRQNLSGANNNRKCY